MEYHWTIFVSWTKRDLNLFEIFVPFQLQNTSIGYIWISPLLQVYFSPWCTMTYGFSPQCTMTYPAEKREKVALTRSLLFKLYLSLPILFTAEVGLWKKGEVLRKGALHVEGNIMWYLEICPNSVDFEEELIAKRKTDGLGWFQKKRWDMWPVASLRRWKG